MMSNHEVHYIESDAEMAAIVSHELAHIILGHQGSSIHPSLRNDPEWLRLKNRSDELLRELSPQDQNNNIETLFDPDSAIFKRYNEAFEQMRLSWQNPENWGNKPGSEAIKSFILKFREGRNLNSIEQAAYDARSVVVETINSQDRKSLLAFEEHLFKILPMIPEYEEITDEIHTYEVNKLGIGVASNWREVEADEVGLELYIKAGWDPDKYDDIFVKWGADKAAMESKLFDDEDSEPKESELPDTEDEKAPLPKSLYLNKEGTERECLRGFRSHPPDCWRVINASQEMVEHSEYYGRFPMKSEYLRGIFSDSLTKLHEKYEDSFFNPKEDENSPKKQPSFLRLNGVKHHCTTHHEHLPGSTMKF